MKQLTSLLAAVLILLTSITCPVISEEIAPEADDSVLETDEDARTLVLNDMGGESG